MPPTDLLKTVTLAVLAGGSGSRMGGPKSLLKIRSKPILDHLLDQLAWPGPTLLVTARGCENPPGAGRFDREVSDTVAGEGPLRGVLTALGAMTSDVLVVVAVDMPLIGREDLSWFVQELEVDTCLHGLMAQNSEGAIEPLPCALRKDAIEIVTLRLASGRRSLHGLVDDPRVRVVDGSTLSPRVWANANTPQEWERIVDQL